MKPVTLIRELTTVIKVIKPNLPVSVEEYFLYLFIKQTIILTYLALLYTFIYLFNGQFGQ